MKRKKNEEGRGIESEREKETEQENKSEDMNKISLDLYKVNGSD